MLAGSRSYDDVGFDIISLWLIDCIISASWGLGSLSDLGEHTFSRTVEDSVNLILKLPGQNRRLKPLLMGAHYDSPLHSPGADHNTSGVAALPELARR